MSPCRNTARSGVLPVCSFLYYPTWSPITTSTLRIQRTPQAMAPTKEGSRRGRTSARTRTTAASRRPRFASQSTSSSLFAFPSRPSTPPLLIPPPHVFPIPSHTPNATTPRIFAPPALSFEATLVCSTSASTATAEGDRGVHAWDAWSEHESREVICTAPLFSTGGREPRGVELANFHGRRL